MSVDEIVMEPAPVVIWTFDPAISVDSEYPPAFPIKSWPLAGAWVSPVPPYITPRAFVRVRVPIDEFVALRVVKKPVAADSEPVVPIDPADRAFVMTADAADSASLIPRAPPIPKLFVMFPEAAENEFVTPRDVRVEAPAEKSPVTPRFPPTPKLFVMFPEAADKAFVTPKLLRTEVPAEKLPFIFTEFPEVSL